MFCRVCVKRLSPGVKERNRTKSANSSGMERKLNLIYAITCTTYHFVKDREKTLVSDMRSNRSSHKHVHVNVSGRRFTLRRWMNGILTRDSIMVHVHGFRTPFYIRPNVSLRSNIISPTLQHR